MKKKYWVYILPILLIAAIGATVFFWPKKSPPTVILISIDTLRADRLGLYGYPRPTSPAINDFGRESIVFKNAVSVAPWTLPSHVTMMTGLYPNSHGVTTPQQKMSADLPTLAEIFKNNGYRTVGYTDGGYVSARFGFARGFDKFIANPRERVTGMNFGNTIEKAENTLKRNQDNSPLFLFLHTYDVHCPYSVPESYRVMFQSSADYIDPNHCGSNYYNSQNITPSQAHYLADQYDASIRSVDDVFKSFVEFLKTLPNYDNIIVILTADHGEEFLEHGRIGHQNAPYRDLLMIPLIIHAPGYSPKEISSSVSLVDLFPTILNLAQIPTTTATDGTSLVPFMKEGNDRAPLRNYQIASSELFGSYRSLLSDDTQLILNSQDGAEPQLFDLHSDLPEDHNICTTDQKRCDKLHETLTSAFGHLTNRYGTITIDAQKKEELKQLKSLGYMK